MNNICTVFGAQILAGICEFAGSVLIGQNVIESVGNGVISSDLDIPDDKLVLGILSSLFSCGIWMLLATYFKMPVSSTQLMIIMLCIYAILYYNIKKPHTIIVPLLVH